MKNQEDTITDFDIKEVKINTPDQRAKRIAERQKLIQRMIKRSRYKPNIEGQLKKARKNTKHPRRQTPHQEIMDEVTRNVRRAVRKKIGSGQTSDQIETKERRKTNCDYQ